MRWLDGSVSMKHGKLTPPASIVTGCTAPSAKCHKTWAVFLDAGSQQIRGGMVVADHGYASSKTCCCCGYKQAQMALCVLWCKT